jgi:1-deoxy-D-xylulose-5-phosphate reductoisomerase
MTRTVSIFGATGSVGLSTLDLIRQHREAYKVVALTANGQAVELAKLAIEFDAEIAVVADDAAYPALKEALAGTSIKAAAGPAALIEAAQMGADWTMAAIVGCAGLPPTMAAIQQGKTVALANKEALVSAGDLMMAAVDRSGATLLPVDSEHNAIFQCLSGAKRSVPHVQPRRNALRHPRPSRRASQLGHGREDQHRFGDDDEQGA